MFISFSKTLARFGGFRLGIGIRLNKKNAIWLSLIVMFVAIFQLMWYMLLLYGWLIYAVCYGIYWCIKKIICASSKKQNNKPKPHTISKATQNQQAERKEETPNMTPKMNNSPNKNPKNQSPKKKSAIVRWIVGGFFAIFALANGFHFSSLFLLCAAFLMFPLPFMETFLQKKNIKVIVAIILSVVLFFAGILTSPLSESNDLSDDTAQTTVDETDNKNNDSTSNNGGMTQPDNTTESDNATSNDTTTEPDTTISSDTTTTEPDTTTSTNTTTTEPDTTTSTDTTTTEPDTTTSTNTTTTEPDTTTSNDAKVEMVWVPSTGTKYHSKSTCSGMKSPRQIPLEDAKKQGYTACSRCY